MDLWLQQLFNDPTFVKILIAVAGTLVILLLVQFIKKPAGRYIHDPDARYRVRKLISFMGYVAVLFLIALVFSDSLGGIAVTLGVAGAGIAFALQEVIASFAGWLAVSFGSFYRVGDRVQLGGIKGDVIDIGILRTTVMEIGDWVSGDQYTGRVVRIANSFVFKEPVFNYSGDFPFLWDEIKIPVKYGSDYKLARSILEKIATTAVGDYAAEAHTAWKNMVEKYLIEDARVEPMIMMVANDNWIEFSMRYVVDYKKRRLTKTALFERILDEFAATNGRVELASATYQVVGMPPLDVRLTQDAKPGD